MTTAGPVSTPAGTGTEVRGRWLMLAVLLLGQFMGLVDVLVVNVAMPAIGADLQAGGAALQLVVGGYTVAYAMLLITGARLGDLYGRRRMYLLGVIGFTLTSLICGFAPNTEVLVTFRFIQGAAAAVMVPQIMSVIQINFAGPARAKALSAYAVVLSTGALVGLIVGGVLVSADLFGYSWRPVFLVNVPIGLFLAILVPRVLPADQPRHQRRLDFAGLAIATAAVCLIVLPLVLGHEVDWPAWTFVCIAAGLVLAALFVPVERRIAARGGDPLVNLDVLHAPAMSAGILTLAAMQITYGGFLFVFTLHQQAGLGHSALRTGLTYIPMSAAFGLAGFYWRKLPTAIHHLLAPTGLALCALAYLGIAGSTGGGPLTWVSLVLAGVGTGLSASPVLTQALVRVPLAQAADASGLLTTTVQLGQVVGVAVFGTVFLTLAGSVTPGESTVHAYESALTTTGYWLAALAVVGVGAGLALARALVRVHRAAAGEGVVAAANA